MEDFLLKIADIIKEWWQALIFVVVLFIYLKFEKITSLFKKKTYERKVNFSDLYKHEIFDELIAFGSESFLYSIKHPNKGRQEMVRDALRIKYKVSIDIIKKGIKECDNKKYKRMSALERKWVEVCSEIIYAYEKKWKEVGINRLWIEKFNKYHNNAVDLLKLQFKYAKRQFVRREDYCDNALYLLMSAYEKAMHDAKDAIVNINGELTGQKYKEYIL